MLARREAQVELLAGDPLQHLGGAADLQGDADVGMLLGKAPDDPRQEAQRHGRQRRDAQRAGPERPDVRGALQNLIQAGEGALDLIVEQCR